MLLFLTVSHCREKLRSLATFYNLQATKCRFTHNLQLLGIASYSFLSRGLLFALGSMILSWEVQMARNDTETVLNSHYGSSKYLPSFFAIGPPRTGTSWLQETLRQSAWLADPIKETNFFDRHYHHGVDWYRAHYRGVPGDKPIGEIAPTYFASPEARERIADLIPSAKVICTFRNPVDRVISLYRLKRAFGLIPWDFEQALALDPELMESSRYSLHLKAWRQTLGEDQVLTAVYDDLKSNAQEFIDRITNFVGAERIPLGPRHIRFVLTSETMTQPRNYYWTRGAAKLSEWSRARRLGKMVAAAKRLGMHKLFLGGGMTFPEMSREQIGELYRLFRPEIEELEDILNRDLSAWKAPKEKPVSGSYAA